ncbi:MAG: NADP-dependent oxidoreductase [Sandaracinus sp.]|nr:NADP-dependent oxidoreductase [Sandaracinus sp.]
MRAARFHRFGPPDVLRVESLPSPRRGRSELLVEVHAAALNPKDVLVRSGARFAAASRPLLPLGVAEDFAGVVRASDDPELPPGTRCFGMLGYFRFGAAAEEVVVKRSEVARMPAIEFVDAASIPLVGLTSLQALRDDAKLRPGERVMVHGASGGVGTSALQIAKAMGAHVTASCSETNHTLVRELGADDVVDYRATPPHTLRERFDVFFDVYGNQPFPKARAVLSPRGRHVSTVPRPADFVWQARTLVSFPRTRVVVVRPRRADLAQLARWVDEGKLRPVLDSVHSLDDVAEAERRVETKRARGKVVLRVR